MNWHVTYCCDDQGRLAWTGAFHCEDMRVADLFKFGEGPTVMQFASLGIKVGIA